MTSNDNHKASSSEDAADLAQAYKELARGEQAATALEANLANLESKLDAILAALEANTSQKPKPKSSSKSTEAEASSNGETNTPGSKEAEP